MDKEIVLRSEDVLKAEPGTGQALSRLGYSPFIFIAAVIMGMAIFYVWSHNYMTSLEYRVAGEISRKETLLEEQARLKVELATLKSPRRIASVAIDKLNMTYPERQQVIFMKDPGQTK